MGLKWLKSKDFILTEFWTGLLENVLRRWNPKYILYIGRCSPYGNTLVMMKYLAFLWN